jgi:hypothetical protein
LGLEIIVDYFLGVWQILLPILIFFHSQIVQTVFLIEKLYSRDFGVAVDFKISFQRVVKNVEVGLFANFHQNTGLDYKLLTLVKAKTSFKNYLKVKK